VLDSGERFVAMEFIPHTTLQDEIERIRSAAYDSDGARWLARLDLLDAIVPWLCDRLRDLAAADQHHLDLSPTNILLAKPRTQAGSWSGCYAPMLIDFGRNYLLAETLGSRRVEKAGVFAAPELRELDGEPDHTLCDLYSLAMIAVDIVSNHPVDHENLREELRVLWRDAPGIARLAEDLLDADPEKRLLLAAPGQADPFAYLRDAVKLEIDVTRKIHPSVSRRRATNKVARFFKVWDVVGLVKRKPPARKDLEAVLDVLARPPVGEPEAPDAESDAPQGDANGSVVRTPELGASRDAGEVRRLRRWLRAHELAWWAVLTLAVLLSVAEIPVLRDWLWTLPGPVDGFLRDHGVLGDPSSNLAARLVALTTAFIAYGYYLYIFAPITLRGAPVPKAAWVERSARWCCLLSILAQGVWLFIPWPPAIIGGTAGLLIGANNAICLYWLVKRAERAAAPETGRTFSTLGDDFGEFVESYGPWWWLMVIYSGTGALIGVLLWTGVLEDLWAYAIMMAIGVNYLKLFLLNIVQEGPRVQGNVRRSIDLLTRAGRYEEEHRAPEEATAPAPQPAITPVPEPG
jgi:hypothetical protein